MVKLLTRGDDAGSCQGANFAIQQCISAETLKNVSVMVPGPAFCEAAEMLLAWQGGIDIGLHVTLNSEWDEHKWSPVSSSSKSLQDEQGWFTPSPAVLNERGFILDEAVDEIRAQLAAARAAGLRIDYLDEHMGVGWLPGLRQEMHKLAEDEGLITLGRFNFVESVAPARFFDYVGGLSPGTYVWVTHPGVQDDTMNQFLHAGLQPGQIASERDAERLLLTSEEFRSRIEDGLFSVGRFSEAQ